MMMLLTGKVTVVWYENSPTVGIFSELETVDDDDKEESTNEIDYPGTTSR